MKGIRSVFGFLFFLVYECLLVATPVVQKTVLSTVSIELPLVLCQKSVDYTCVSDIFKIYYVLELSVSSLYSLFS